MRPISVWKMCLYCVYLVYENRHVSCIFKRLIPNVKKFWSGSVYMKNNPSRSRSNFKMTAVVYNVVGWNVAKSDKIYYRLSNWIGSAQSIISSIFATNFFKKLRLFKYLHTMYSKIFIKQYIFTFTCLHIYLEFVNYMYTMSLRNIYYTLLLRDSQYLVSLRDTHIAFYCEIYIKYVCVLIYDCMLTNTPSNLHSASLVIKYSLHTIEYEWGSQVVLRLVHVLQKQGLRCSTWWRLQNLTFGNIKFI